MNAPHFSATRRSVLATLAAAGATLAAGPAFAQEWPAGKVITYHNIVTSWDSLGNWPGNAPLELSAPVQGAEPAVVIVQEEGPASILAAARAE